MCVRAHACVCVYSSGTTQPNSGSPKNKSTQSPLELCYSTTSYKSPECFTARQRSSRSRSRKTGIKKPALHFQEQCQAQIHGLTCAVQVIGASEGLGRCSCARYWWLALFNLADEQVQLEAQPPHYSEQTHHGLKPQRLKWLWPSQPTGLCSILSALPWLSGLDFFFS